jgi:hypothetical protein
MQPPEKKNILPTVGGVWQSRKGSTVIDPVFVWRNCGNPHTALVRIDGALPEI